MCRIIDGKEKHMNQHVLVVAATFTAEPLEPALAFWIRQLNLPFQVVFAPYNQIFQQLLEPTSLLSQNQQGVNVLLVRFEDWLRSAASTQPLHTAASMLEKHSDDLIQAIRTAADRTALPYLLCICPASQAIGADVSCRALFAHLEERFQSALEDVRGVYMLPSTECIAAYPAEPYDDPTGDALGHIPFTPVGFVSMGSLIARKLFALCSAPHKVIVLDCDQTLWQGVCGEDGALGVVVTPAHQTLQEFMVAQYRAGMLLCLCSKNHEEDVFAVFDQHPDMRLRREHLVTWRINWQSKAVNIHSLAQELQLGLDSFIFLDDNPVECAEVQARCPEVLTLQIPEDAETIPRFLRHVWAFDRLRVTAEDRKRTVFYQQNVQRERFRHAALSLEDFLGGLQLEVLFSPVTPKQYPRVAQLTQRTNQFNITTRRRSESDIAQMWQEEQLHSLLVEVRDRFGNYGVVGVLFFRVGPVALTVDTFLLSCRAMGKGVEHQMLAKLGSIAQEHGLERVDVPYIPSKKNQPAIDFLRSIGQPYQHVVGTELLYQFPAAYATALTYDPQHAVAVPLNDGAEPTEVVALSADGGSATGTLSKSACFGRIATELCDAARILQAMACRQSQTRPVLPTAFVAPRTPIEATVAEIWQSILGIEQIGVHDNFFEMGGNSVQVVQVLSRIQERLAQEISMQRFFDAPTVEGCVIALTEQYTAEKEPALLQRLLSEIECLAEDEVPPLRHLSIAAAPVASASYCATAFERFAMSSHEVLVYDKHTHTTHVLPTHVADVLSHCLQCKSLDRHAQDVCRDLGCPEGHAEAIKNQLVQLVDIGLLVSPQSFLVCRAPAKHSPQSPAGITALAVVTANRVRGLQRALSSYLDNCQQHGCSNDFVVVDDSQSQETREACRQVVSALQRRYGVPVFYAGYAEKVRFAQHLAKHADIPPEIVDFALFDVERCGVSSGANRNALLLHTVGDMVLSVDDDTMCRIAPAPQQEKGWRITAKSDPAEVWFLANREAALQSVPCVDTDFLGLHGQLLGKNVRDLLATAGATTEVDVTHLAREVWHRLAATESKVLVTFNGVVGDCAWGSPFGYWGSPMGYLLLDTPSHARLVCSEADYRHACRSREIVRTVRRFTISDAAGSIGYCMGYDNQSLLPPFFPVRRGQDVLFSQIIWKCCAPDVFGHLPWTILHAPETPRQFWPGELLRSAAGSDTTKLLLDCIQSFSVGVGQHHTAERLRALGHHLMAIGDLVPEDFIEFVRLQGWHTQSVFLSIMEEHLRLRGERPAFWASDVKQYQATLRQALSRADYWLPLDLLAGRNVEEARALAQRLVRKFGQLLAWWPTIIDAARDLRMRGHRMAVPV